MPLRGTSFTPGTLYAMLRLTILNFLLMNKSSYIIILFIYLIQLHHGCSTKSVNDHSKYVLLKTGLQLFDCPNDSCKVITKIDFNEKVIVLNTLMDKSFTINGFTGYFSLVSYKNFKGYIFNGFLSKYPAIPKNYSDLIKYPTLYFGEKDGSLLKTIDPEDPKSIIHKQKYINGSSSSFYNGSSFSNFHFKFSISNITLQEGFLLARSYYLGNNNYSCHKVTKCCVNYTDPYYGFCVNKLNDNTIEIHIFLEI